MQNHLIRKFLKIALRQKLFWVNYGPIVRSLPQLIDVITTMKSEIFKYHVNIDHNKNDFADWIRSALKDRGPAMKLEGVMDQKEYLRILNEQSREFDSIKKY
jgi:hypothetical protein